MEPFRGLLKAKSIYAWNDDLQGAFEKSKEEIAGLLVAGVKAFVIGSRICTPAESRHAVIKEELLGVKWALSKTSHYTLGCKHLLFLVN